MSFTKPSVICTILLAIFTIITTTHAAPINFGNDTVNSADTHIFGGDALLGLQINVTHNTVATHIGSIYQGTGNQVQFGIYSDFNNAPDQLIASTNPHNIIYNSHNHIPLISNTPINAGTYWLLSLYDVQATGTMRAESTTNPYILTSFTGSMPPVFPASHLTYVGRSFNYYLITDINAPIPEPASLALLSFTIAPIFLRRKKIGV
ncbi:hypothetical protein KS4_01080 [Poriferisphaera corsica]|uniref:PEP-CTERM protein-sorting domain-containing protein n=1 Tax=Poriferisphaera corsica TaxID=2528020 RepID=A0A517YPD7_9BACT|nr:PEP-CTERM sorting domain-containing protein [Poriferisphaera corsica]QDU32079.1 hypothetical protein KS4_01080 [Poriferisphaera corsica]